jgi:phage shock protein PspC (stress-responsive transcriptional regulator)
VRHAVGSKWWVRALIIVAAFFAGPPVAGVLIYALGSMIFPH